MAEPLRKIRAVFTGHAGLDKRSVLDRLAAEIIRQRPGATVKVFHAEAKLKAPEFLKLDLPQQRQQWRNSLKSAIDAWAVESDHLDCALLSLHLTFYWHSHIFSPLSWKIRTENGASLEDTILENIGARFKPTHFVTLIDDAQAVRGRLKNYSFRLRDILRWRNAETMLTDVFAKYAISDGIEDAAHPYERSAIVAIRHPATMLYRFLMEPEVPRVYASFPIGFPRREKDPDKRKEIMEEIGRFRSALHKHFTVFDPLTIDEMPIKILHDKLAKSDKKVRGTKKSQEKNRASLATILAADQWAIEPSGTLCAEARGDVQLERDDIREVATPYSSTEKCEVERHVEKRDYRLIDQSDCVVIYRPTYGGKKDWSTGTYHEALYAYQTGKPIIVLHDDKKDGHLVAGSIGIELAPTDHHGVSGLSDHDKQQQALTWVVDEIRRRANELTSSRSKKP